jgi:hypothetical protein
MKQKYREIKEGTLFKRPDLLCLKDHCITRKEFADAGG